MYGRSVEVKIELGHKAVLKDQPTAEGYTHDWTVFVKGPEGCKIDNFVEKVIFMLHESFPKSKRTIREPPYQVTESGYAGFNMPIWVYFKTREEPKKIDFVYDLYLSLDGKPINNIRCEKLTFHNPPDDFCQRLLKGGGSIKQPVASPNKKSSGPQTPPEKRSPQQPQTQPAGAAAKPSSDLFGGSNAKDIKSGTAPAQDGKKEKKKEKRSKDYKKEKKDKDGRSRSDKDKEAAPSSREEKTTSKEKERDKESSKSEKERDKAETKADQERDSKLKENTKDKERTSGKESKDKEATAKQKEGSSSSSSKKLASVRSSQSPPMAADMKKDDTKNREDRKRPAGISPSEGSGERDREKTNNDDKEVKRKKKSSSHKDSPDAKKPRLTQDQLTSGSSESLKSKRSKSRGKESLASSPFVESNDDMELSFTPSPPESKSALRPPSDRKRSAPKDKSASPTERKEVRPPPPPTSRSKKAAATPSSSSSPSPMHSVSAPTNSSNRKKSPNKQSAQQQQQQPIGALAAMMMEMDAESVSSPEPDDRRRDKLSVLKVKILKLSDEKLQQVVDIIEMTGKYELSNESFDFDLQQIDNLTINRLQQLVS